MKNFILGFLICSCMGFFVIMSYMLWCPEAKRHRDTHVTNQMILPYNGFVLKPFNRVSVVPHNKFPFMSQEKDENINKNKDVLPEFIE